MNRMTNNELARTARRLLIENDFAADAPAAAVESAKSIAAKTTDLSKDARDLRSLLWSSIDNKSSLDLDQVEYAERLPNNDIKLLVGIADVDHFAPKNSAIDKFAYKNTVSIYAAHQVFPMLPEELSTDLTSLRENADRLAVVLEMIVRADGDVQTTNVYRALVRNRAKLNYEETSAWLDDDAPMPEKIENIDGLKAQILLQQEAAKLLYELRKKKGALEFETVESSLVVENGAVTEIKGNKRNNGAREIIENFMIAANVEMAEFLESRHSIALRRVVKIPARWNRIVEIAKTFNVDLPDVPDSVALAEFLKNRQIADPVHFPDLSLSVIKLLGAGEYVVEEPNAIDTGGHFGLAVQDYAHSTAPNRRYADLIVQRLVKAALENKPSPYSFEELQTIAAHCNERESAARKVERRIRKIVAASVMSSRVGESFDAIVTGINKSGTFARTISPPVDGRIVAGEGGLEIGEKVRVKLIDTDAEKGFIDFACRH